MTKEENIMLHAEKLFSIHGFDGTSTREIAKAAEINISMIAYYFGSKEKLLEKIFEFRPEDPAAYRLSRLCQGFFINPFQLAILDVGVRRIIVVAVDHQRRRRPGLRAGSDEQA